MNKEVVKKKIYKYKRNNLHTVRFRQMEQKFIIK